MQDAGKSTNELLTTHIVKSVHGEKLNYVRLSNFNSQFQLTETEKQMYLVNY